MLYVSSFIFSHYPPHHPSVSPYVPAPMCPVSIFLCQAYVSVSLFSSYMWVCHLFSYFLWCLIPVMFMVSQFPVMVPVCSPSLSSFTVPCFGSCVELDKRRDMTEETRLCFPLHHICCFLSLDCHLYICFLSFFDCVSCCVFELLDFVQPCSGVSTLPLPHLCI